MIQLIQQELKGEVNELSGLRICEKEQDLERECYAFLLKGSAMKYRCLKISHTIESQFFLLCPTQYTYVPMRV